MKKRAIFAVLAALVSAFALWLHLEIHERELLTLVFAIGLYFLFKRSFSNENKRISTAAIITGSLFALFYTLNDSVRFFGTAHYTRSLIICFLGFAFMFSALLDRIFRIFEKKEFMLDSLQHITTGRKCAVFYGIFALIFLYFIFWLLTLFPGNMSTDSYIQLEQAVGLRPYSNHHPMVHTLLIQCLYNYGLKLFDGNQNNALALYCAFQAFLMAGCFAYLFETLYISRMKIKYILLVLLALFTFGYHGVYSVTVWKDVLFAGWTLALSCTIWRLILLRSENPVKTPLLETILLFVFGLLFCLFRSNGLYAFVVCTPFLFFIFIRKTPAVSAAAVAALVLAFVIKGPVFSHFDIVPSDLIESLAVPAQHIAAAVKDGAELTDEEYNLLSEVIDIQSIYERFTPNCADGIKELVREEDNQTFIKENISQFFGLWLKLGARNPASYLKAQIELTSGYWYPDNTVWAFTIELIGLPESMEHFELHKDCKLPQTLYDKIDRFWVEFYDLPIVSLVFSIATGLYFTLTAFALCFVKKAHLTMLVFLPVLAIMATLFIATPINNEFRYAYGMFTTLPLLCVIPFIPIKKTDRRKVETL